LEIGEAPKLSPFFLWNFGYTDSNYFAIQNHDVPGRKPTSTNDHDLLDLLGKEMNLVWPINVCGDAPLARTAGDSWRYHFPIFFGTSPWNILAYWNDALTTGPTSSLHGGMKQLWLTKQIMEDEAAYKRLARLLQLKVHSGNPQRRRVAQTTDGKTVLGAAYAGFACAGLESTSSQTNRLALSHSVLNHF